MCRHWEYLSSQNDFSHLAKTIDFAKKAITAADEVGLRVLITLQMTDKSSKEIEECENAVEAYNTAFKACRELLKLDKLAFHSECQY